MTSNSWQNFSFWVEYHFNLPDNVISGIYYIPVNTPVFHKSLLFSHPSPAILTFCYFSHKTLVFSYFSFETPGTTGTGTRSLGGNVAWATVHLLFQTLW